MRRTLTKWRLVLTLVMVAGLLLGACRGAVSQADYDVAKRQLQEKEAQLQARQGELQAKEAELTRSQRELATAQSRVGELQKAMPAPTPPFGIAVEKFDASGPPAYEAKPGALLAFVQSGMAYDSPADANYVTVIDVSSHQVLAKVAIPMAKGAQSHGLGVSAGARWLYLPDLSGESKKLYIVDGRTLKLTKTLDVGAATHHTDEGSYKQTGKFVMVDTYNPEHGAILLDPNNDNAIVGRIPFGAVLGRPYSTWSSPDGSFAYAAVRSHLGDQKGWISRIDLSTYKETGFTPVGVAPAWVTFAADGKTAWVSDTASNDVMQIKIAQNKSEKDSVVATVPLTFSPYGMELSRDGKKLYVVNKTYGPANASTGVAVVDTEAKKVVKEIKVGMQPDHVFLSPDGTEIWVTENRGNEVSIINVVTDEVKGHIATPGDAHTVRFVQF